MLVEAPRHLLGEGKKCSGGGVISSETMLGALDREVVKLGEQQSLHNLYGRAQERYWAVASPGIR